MNLENIKEGFICCSNDTKKVILKKLKDVKKYIFITPKDLINTFYGSVSNKGLYLLMKEYHVGLDFAKECSEYIPFVDKIYGNVKLDNLYQMRKFLEANDVFSKNEMLLYRLSQYPVTILDLPTGKVYDSILNKLKNITSVEDIRFSDVDSSNKKLDVYVFDDAQGEARFICEKIIELKKQGIKNSNIFISSVDAAMKFELKRLSQSFNLAFELEEEKNIKISSSVKRFLELLNIKTNFKEVFDGIKEYENSEIYKKLLSIMKTYDLYEENPKDTYMLFDELLKEASFSNTLYEDMISVADISSYYKEDYVFLPTLNIGVCPAASKDDLYLTDVDLNILGLPSSKERTIDAYNKLKNQLFYTSHAFISYRKTIDGKEAYKASVLDEFVINELKYNPKFGISEVEDKIELAKNISLYFKYGSKDSSLTKYNTKSTKYDEYDNSFKGVDRKKINAILDSKEKKWLLSYSSMKEYYACPFKYYAKYILGLDQFESTMAIKLGNVMHDTLEKSYIKNNDNSIKTIDPAELDDLYYKVIEESKTKKKNPVSYDEREEFFLELMKKDVLKKVFTFNKEMEDKIGLDKVLCEQSIEDKVYGRIDKILYKEIDNTIYAMIIDYKTGKDKMGLYNVEDGFSLQLPMYTYLINKYKEFKGKEVKVIGVYLQKLNRVLSNENPDFRLQGFSTTDVINQNCNGYINIRITDKNVFHGSDLGKVMTYENEDELNKCVENLIDEAYKNIRDASFKINPLVITNESGKPVEDSCKYCNYKDICYKKYDDENTKSKKLFLNNKKEKDGK